MGAEPRDVAEIAHAQRPGVFDVRLGVDQGHTAHHEAGDDERRERPGDTARLRCRQHQDERPDDDRQIGAVVHRREHLQAEEEPGQHAEPDRAGFERTVDGPQRQRHPGRPLQLEVHEMLDAVRGEREDRGRHERRVGAAGQMPDEDEHTEARGDDAGEEEDVVDEDRVDLRLQPGRGEGALQKRGVRVGQRPQVRVEDVAVEQMPPAGRRAMGEPLEAPDTEERVAVVGDPGTEVEGLRPRQQQRERADEDQRAQNGAVQGDGNPRAQHRGRYDLAIKGSADSDGDLLQKSPIARQYRALATLTSCRAVLQTSSVVVQAFRPAVKRYRASSSALSLRSRASIRCCWSLFRRTCSWSSLRRRTLSVS